MNIAMLSRLNELEERIAKIEQLINLLREESRKPRDDIGQWVADRQKNKRWKNENS